LKKNHHEFVSYFKKVKLVIPRWVIYIEKLHNLKASLSPNTKCSAIESISIHSA
jgi:hypothetical protein